MPAAVGAATSSSPRPSSPASSSAPPRVGEHGVEVLLDPGLDPAAEGAEQQAEPRRQLERVGVDDELAVDAGARELDDVARLAFDHGALHAELLLGRLGPLPGGLARLGEAEAVLAVDVDVGHGGASGVGSIGDRASLALERGAPLGRRQRGERAGPRRRSARSRGLRARTGVSNAGTSAGVAGEDAERGVVRLARTSAS